MVAVILELDQTSFKTVRDIDKEKMLYQKQKIHQTSPV